MGIPAGRQQAPDQQAPTGRSYDILWLSLALLIPLIIACLLPLAPQDYWWYLRLGRDISASGTVPVVDTYSYSRAGTPFHYQSWLSAVILWFVHATGGITLTVLLRLLVVTLTYGTLWWVLRRRGAGPRLASMLVLVSGLAGSNNWAFRPQLLTYPLFVLALLVLWDWHQGSSRRLWILPLISVLWVNLHGSFPLLFILLASALVVGAGHRRPLLLAAVVSAGAVLLNPRGLDVVNYVGSILGAPSSAFSAEWHAPANRGWQANIFFLWLLCIAPLVAWSRRRLTALEWVWLLVFGWLGLYGVRYGIWFLFILPLLTARLLSEWTERFIDRPIKREQPVVNAAAAGLLLLLPLSLLPGVRENWWPDSPAVYDGANPIQAVEWLAAHPELPGPLWSDFSHSSYLIFALPSRPVWIDPRFELFPPEHWQRYTAVATASLDWQSILDEEQSNLVMLSTGGQPRLIRAMQASAEWCELYGDANAVIFTRATTAGCR